MEPQRPAEVALLDLLRELNASPDVPISNYEIGPPLVAKGFTQDEIVSAMEALGRQGHIEIMTGNRTRVTKPL